MYLLCLCFYVPNVAPNWLSSHHSVIIAFLFFLLDFCIPSSLLFLLGPFYHIYWLCLFSHLSPFYQFLPHAFASFAAISELSGRLCSIPLCQTLWHLLILPWHSMIHLLSHSAAPCYMSIKVFLISQYHNYCSVSAPSSDILYVILLKSSILCFLSLAS